MQDTKLYRPLGLWLSMFGAPIVWAVHFSGVWAISEIGCRLEIGSSTWFGGANVLHVLTLGLSAIAMILFCVVGLIGFSALRKIGNMEEDAREDYHREVQRTRFMTQVGLFFTALFAVVSLYVTIPIFFIPLCD